MDTRRLILVLIFAFSSFMLFESWQKYNQPQVAANTVATNSSGNAIPKPSTSLQGKHVDKLCNTNGDCSCTSWRNFYDFD